MKIITGGYEVHSSGSVYCPKLLGETTFVISEQPKMEIVFKIKDDKTKEKGIELEAVNDYTLAIVFTNPSGLGYGNSSPIKIGHLNGKEIYANFHVDIKGNDEAYTLSYTFLVRENPNG